MRIVSLHYALTDLIVALGAGGNLVGVSYPTPANVKGVDVVAEEHPNPVGALEIILEQKIQWSRIESAQPTHIFVGAPDPEGLGLEAYVQSKIEKPVAVTVVSFKNLTKTLEAYEEVGKKLKAADKGRLLAQKLKSQLLDWGDNFYDRLRSKRVVVLTSIQPLRVAGGWLGETCRLVSAKPFETLLEKEITSQQLVEFNPHVMIIAPTGYSFVESKKSFLYLEKQRWWEDLWAVKRGEVYFTAGTEEFHSPGPNVLLNAGSILISAIAGIDSGYISPKDSFVRLRSLELFRHLL